MHIWIATVYVTGGTVPLNSPTDTGMVRRVIRRAASSAEEYRSLLTVELMGLYASERAGHSPTIEFGPIGEPWSGVE